MGSNQKSTSGERLVKSKQRVADHGEVFTPEWAVNDMLDLVKDETERIDSRFLEPACGSGNFLVEVLRRAFGRQDKILQERV
jgi:type I restriction-modification system DNA methylase subunit